MSFMIYKELSRCLIRTFAVISVEALGIEFVALSFGHHLFHYLEVGDFICLSLLPHKNILAVISVEALGKGIGMIGFVMVPRTLTISLVHHFIGTDRLLILPCKLMIKIML